VIEFNQYFGQFNGLRGKFGGQWGGLPPWARTIVGIFALPGLVLLALSIVAFLVSLLALLLLTVPAYSLLRRMTGGGDPGRSTSMNSPFGVTIGSPVDVPSGTKRVDSTVVE
jgi:hypothetical protein